MVYIFSAFLSWISSLPHSCYHWYFNYCFSYFIVVIITIFWLTIKQLNVFATYPNLSVTSRNVSKTIISVLFCFSFALWPRKRKDRYIYVIWEAIKVCWSNRASRFSKAFKSLWSQGKQILDGAPIFFLLRTTVNFDRFCSFSCHCFYRC